MRNIFFSILAICLLSSCYDDKSTLRSVEYPSIVAGINWESEYLTAFYGTEFTYEPLLYRVNDRNLIPLTESEFDDYTYEWDCTLVANGNDTTRQVLFRERILKTAFQLLPTSGERSFYTLTLHVIHKASGVKKNLVWKIKLLGTYGAGLLVAETADENKSDISLIMSRTFNLDLTGYDADVTRRELYSQNNNTLIDGVVNILSYVEESGIYSDISALVKGKSLIRMDPVTMKYMDQDQECFFYAPNVYNPQAIFHSWGYSILINNGAVHYYDTYRGNKYSIDTESEYDLAEAHVGELGYVDAILFDKKTEKFVQFSVRSREVMDLGPVAPGEFDPNDMEGFECIYGDVGDNTTARWLMKKEGHYYIYEMDQDEYTGLNIYDLANCPDVDKSLCYVFSGSNSEFYYSVDNVLYVVPLVGEKPERLVSYDKFNSKEKITHVMMYKGSGYTTWSEETNLATGETRPFWRESDNNVLCVVTYDGQEGRVYTLPVQYGGSGGIAPEKYVRCYDKFSRITAISSRK